MWFARRRSGLARACGEYILRGMSDRVPIALEPLGQSIQVERGAPLRDLLFRYGVEFPCGGQGR